LYEQALQTQTDGYTALAYADLLLRTGQFVRVGPALVAQPATDGVMIRRAAAARRMQDPAWKTLAQELFARRAQLALRDDDSAAHAREHALIALWLEDDPQEAWRQAQRNYTLQREAFDAWLLVQAAQATANPSHANTARQQIQAVGIMDARIRTVTAS
jgi:1,2-phenylacetyl-CoA epoxidase PaaB subunit